MVKVSVTVVVVDFVEAIIEVVVAVVVVGMASIVSVHVVDDGEA